MSNHDVEEKLKEMSDPCIDECAICDSGIRKIFDNTLGATFWPTTKAETVNIIDKNTQTFLVGMYKNKKTDNAICEKDQLIPKRCNSVLDHAGEGDTTMTEEMSNFNRKTSSLVEGDVSQFKVVSSKSDITDKNMEPTEIFDKKRPTNKESLCRLENDVTTVNGEDSTASDTAHSRALDSKSVSDGERLSNVDTSHKTIQEKEGTPPRDRYGLKDTQTSESYSSDVIITYDLKGDIVYLKPKCLPGQESANKDCPPNTQNVVKNDPNPVIIVTMNAEESFHAGKQEAKTTPKDQEATEPAASETWKKRNTDCIADDHNQSTARREIDSTENVFKSDYDSFTIVECRNDESKPEEVNITNNAPKFPDMDSEKCGPQKKLHKNPKIHKQATKLVYGDQTAEGNDENVQENGLKTDDVELELENEDIPSVKNCKENVMDTVDSVKISNVPIPPNIPTKVEESKETYTYDEAHDVWDLEMKGRIDWGKKQSVLSANTNGLNPTSSVPYMNIPGVFDRGALYRMDDKQVIVKSRRGRKKEVSPKKVKRKGIPNKHLMKKIDYFQENAFEKDYDDLNETNNSKTDVMDKVLAFPYKCETEEKILQQEEAMPDITNEQITELGDNRDLLLESSNIILRKMGEWNKLEEKYAVKKSPKTKGKKSRKRAAGNKVNFNANNNANDEISTEDESSTEDDSATEDDSYSDTTSDDEDDDDFENVIRFHPHPINESSTTFENVIHFHPHPINESSTTLGATATQVWSPLD